MQTSASDESRRRSPHLRVSASRLRIHGQQKGADLWIRPRSAERRQPSAPRLRERKHGRRTGAEFKRAFAPRRRQTCVSSFQDLRRFLLHLKNLSGRSLLNWPQLLLFHAKLSDRRRRARRRELRRLRREKKRKTWAENSRGNDASSVARQAETEPPRRASETKTEELLKTELDSFVHHSADPGAARPSRIERLAVRAVVQNLKGKQDRQSFSPSNSKSLVSLTPREML